MSQPASKLLTSAQVRERYGDISGMSLWRWLRDHKLGFPQPIIINRRRYWSVDRLDQFDRACRLASKPAAAA